MVGYLKYFLKDKSVASLLPTRRQIVRRICSHLDFKHSKNIIEYGPGLGAISRVILKHLRGDGRLFAFETNVDMAKMLALKLAEKRLYIFNHSALEVDKMIPADLKGEIDCVVSGIPLSMLQQEERRKLFLNTHAILKPNGLFLIYQTIPMLNNTIGYDITPELRQFFSNLTFKDEALSIPPLRVYIARKGNRD